MNEIVDMIVNNSLSVVLVAFYLIKDYKFNNELVKTLESIQDKLSDIHDKCVKGGKNHD